MLVGGYGSSKSYNCATKIILKLLEEKRTALVVRNVFETIRDSCYSLFDEISAAMGLTELKFNKSPMQVQFPNGSKIIFKGLDNPAKLKSINGVSLIWLEECSEASYAAFKELVGRLRHPTLPLHMILSTNPVSKSNWVYKHFFLNKHIDEERFYREKILREGGVYYHHSTIADNAFLPESYRKTLDEIKSYDADLYRIARLGRFGTNGLRVLPQFEVKARADVMKAVEEIPRRNKYVGMDFGFVTSYNAVVRVAVDDDKKILYLYWEYYDKNKTDEETAEDLREFVRTKELIKADSAEPKAIRYYQNHGFNMVATRKWNGGTRHARLDNLRKVKLFHKIICSDECLNCIEELQNLTYKTDKDGNIIEDEFSIDAHTLSAIFYGLDEYQISNPKYLLRKADLGL